VDFSRMKEPQSGLTNPEDFGKFGFLPDFEILIYC
jgi:hypothetical protein